MQKYLLIDAYRDSDKKQITSYLPATWFLARCQEATNAVKAEVPIEEAALVKTSVDKPYAIQSFKHWIAVWQMLHQYVQKDTFEAQPVYFLIGRRVIVKRARYHQQGTTGQTLMDRVKQGPIDAMATDDHLKRQRVALKTDIAKRIEAIQYQMALVNSEAPSKGAKGPTKEKASARKSKQEEEGPVKPKDNDYVKIYGALSPAALKFELDQLTKGDPREDHGGDGYYMADANYSGVLPQRVWTRYEGASYPDFAAYLRAILADAEKRVEENFIRLLHRLVADPDSPLPPGLGETLPLLASVIFLAEPARQPRTFLNGLLGLDLLGSKYGKGKKTYNLTGMLGHPSDTFKDPKGGKLAAARPGSADNPDYPSVEDEATLKDLGHVTQQREASMLIRWLCLKPMCKLGDWNAKLVAPGSRYEPEKDRSNLLSLSDENGKLLLANFRIHVNNSLTSRLAGK